MLRRLRLLVVMTGVAGLLLAACGDDDTGSDAAAGGGSGSQPTVVVTTNILGDVVEAFAGDQVDVVTIMPVGADPHDFQASAQQANQMREADAMIVNGAGFEEGLVDVIDAATDDGVPTHEAMSSVDTVEFGEGGHDHDDHGDEDHSDEDHSDEDHSDDDHSEEDHSDEGDHDHDEEGALGSFDVSLASVSQEDSDDHDDEDHGDEDHGDEDHEDHADEDHDDHGHDHDGDDPHFFTDPARMADAVDGIADFLVDTVDGIDADALRTSADDYIGSLEDLDAEVESVLADLDDDQRVLVTNHEVFGYFADRYDFEVVGTVIPSGSTADGADAGALAELAELVEDEGVPAIFADTSSNNELADTLAAEVGGEVAVVELFTESLGEAGSRGGTYLEMVQTNAERIADALAG